jgi:hypothetical protein
MPISLLTDGELRHRPRPERERRILHGVEIGAFAIFTAKLADSFLETRDYSVVVLMLMPLIVISLAFGGRVRLPSFGGPTGTIVTVRLFGS